MCRNQRLNESVRKAFNAWQMGDKKLFLSFFEEDASLINDTGVKRKLNHFVRSTCGQLKFISIDKVENDGRKFTGTLYSRKNGKLDVYFKFILNQGGLITCLQVGLASKNNVR